MFIPGLSHSNVFCFHSNVAGVEIRYPFVDPDLVRIALELPAATPPAERLSAAAATGGLMSTVQTK
eukprot:3689426-Amphidinium_carterae.1